MTAGYNPFEPDRRSQEQRDEDDAREFAQVVFDEIIERIAKSETVRRVGTDLIVERLNDLIAGENLERLINEKTRRLQEMASQPAPAGAAE